MEEEKEGDTGRCRTHVPPQSVQDLSVLPDEIEIKDEEEGKKRRYHHRVIETNAYEYRELIPWQEIGTKSQQAREEKVRQ